MTVEEEGATKNESAEELTEEGKGLVARSFLTPSSFERVISRRSQTTGSLSTPSADRQEHSEDEGHSGGRNSREAEKRFYFLSKR